jgi:hypothetical protein
MKKKVQSLLFATLFSVLDDPTIAMNCFTPHTFSTSFLKLMFDEKYADSVINSFMDCSAKFPELPGPIMAFLSSTFQSSMSETIVKLISNLIKCVRLNQNLSRSFARILLDCVGFARRLKSREAFELSLTFLTVVTQSSNVSNLDESEFLELSHELKSDEPSENLLVGMINVMGGASNLGMERLFSIRIPSAISLLFCLLPDQKDWFL